MSLTTTLPSVHQVNGPTSSFVCYDEGAAIASGDATRLGGPTSRDETIRQYADLQSNCCVPSSKPFERKVRGLRKRMRRFKKIVRSSSKHAARVENASSLESCSAERHGQSVLIPAVTGLKPMTPSKREGMRRQTDSPPTIHLSSSWLSDQTNHKNRPRLQTNSTVSSRSILSIQAHAVLSECTNQGDEDRESDSSSATSSAETKELTYTDPSPRVPVSRILPSVVLVGLWDPRTKKVRNVGSGFVVDHKKGLVVTAGHVFYDLQNRSHYGKLYFGLDRAEVVVGVIPECGEKAIFRYFAEVVADDPHVADACIVQIKSKTEADHSDMAYLRSARRIGLDREALVREKLQPLRLTTRFELEEDIRIFGFSQTSQHINFYPDFAKGYICQFFETSELCIPSRAPYCPHREIVAHCPTRRGHGGAPCVNDDGQVVGILSRCDPVDRQTCYLVPASSIVTLLKEARNRLRH